jgi:hypothetical protein
VSREPPGRPHGKRGGEHERGGSEEGRLAETARALRKESRNERPASGLRQSSPSQADDALRMAAGKGASSHQAERRQPMNVPPSRTADTQTLDTVAHSMLAATPTASTAQATA